MVKKLTRIFASYDNKNAFLGLNKFRSTYANVYMTRSHTTTPFAYYLFILFLVEFNVAKPEWTAKTDFIFPYIFKEFPGIFSIFS